MMRLAFLGLAALAAACATPETPRSQPAATRAFETALHDGDLEAVQLVAADSHRPPAEAALARAALDSWWRQADRADGPLVTATTDTRLSEGLRRQALLLLAGLRIQQSRYADAAAALDLAFPLIADAKEHKDAKDARDFDAALAGVAPLEARVSGPGVVPLSRDLAGLNRGPIIVNGQTLDAIIDTGSSVNTISEGNARRLGLQLLPGKVSIGTATSENVSAGLAIAQTLTFGSAEFHNVVFLTLPDDQLTFANGAYVVQAIIGMPILVELGRVEYSTIAGKEALSYARGSGKPGPGSNLMVEGQDPYTFAHVEGSGRAIRLFLDNGAITTHLNHRFAAEFPAIAATGQAQSVTRTGAAGPETKDALNLPNLTLRIGQSSAAISGVDIIDDAGTNRHGDIGLDALRTAPGYVLDFEAMRLELLPHS